MGKGHRQRPIQDQQRWDSEYDRIFPGENDGETQSNDEHTVHREGDGKQEAQPTEVHRSFDPTDAS